MPYVMTTGGSTGCNHGGSAVLSSSSKLTIGGRNVVVASDVPNWSIAPGCSQTNGSNGEVPCSLFVSFTGQSAKLKVGGQAVVLDLFSGTTNGKPDSTGASASAGQSKFSSV